MPSSSKGSFRRHSPPCGRRSATTPRSRPTSSPCRGAAIVWSLRCAGSTSRRAGIRGRPALRWLPAGGTAESAERPAQAPVAAAPPVTGDRPARAAAEGIPADRRRRLISMTLGLAAAGSLGWLFLASGENPLFAPSRPARRSPTRSSAWCSRRGNLWAQRGVESVRRATELMQQAVKEAPESAEAHAWLALSMMTRASYLGGGEAACERAAEQARRAIELDPDDPIALCAAGVLALQVDFDARSGDRAIWNGRSRSIRRSCRRASSSPRR